MANHREPPRQPPGKEGKPIKNILLEAGANLLQDVDVMDQFDIYVAGLHCGKHDPQMQMEAHHFCHQVNGDFIQCVVLDGNTPGSNLIGVEYIVSETLFRELPREERQYWHPHNYEIFSGTLVAPGIPDVAEKQLMSVLMNSYGKTWHFWHTGTHSGDPGHGMPMGEPNLMWSFNRDGEAKQDLEADFCEAMGIDRDKKEKQRADLIERAHPQEGVNLLKGAFPGAEEELPGVRDVEDED